jgi:cyanophycinase
MKGTIALHGGGEFLPGDEGFLRAILARAPASNGIIRIAIVPTAAARGRPDLAAANGVAAFERVGVAAGLTVHADAVRVVDPASAADAALAAILAAADLIHLPGGDPDLIPSLYPGTAAWTAIRSANDRGAVLAGASAGAMALGSITWTPAGLVAGLGLATGIVVVPHADARSWSANLIRFGHGGPSGIGVLGIGERTGVLIDPLGPWRVAGEGEVRWLAPGASHDPDPDAAIVLRDGDTIPATGD